MADAHAVQADAGPPGGMPDGRCGPGAAVVVTCEHGGNRVPPEVAQLFTTEGDHLAGHGGYDAGALEMARAFAAWFHAPLFYTTITRLVVDQNRSLGHPKHFSRYTKGQPQSVRQALLDAHYRPMRREVLAAVTAVREAGKIVIHLASHSFVPVWRGAVRSMDMGLLYDPRRDGERALCAAWKSQLAAARPELRVRRNAPYRGVSDGHVTALRRRFPAGYLGIELEMNQRFVTQDRPVFEALLRVFPATFAAALADIGLDCGDAPPPAS